MRVYRVETPDGKGPYWEGAIIDGMGRAHTLPETKDNHPSPYNDGLSDCTLPVGTYFFGFTSLAMLNQWFAPEWREKMKAVGHQIAVYDMPECNIVEGKYQCAFKRGKSKPIEHLPLMY